MITVQVKLFATLREHYPQAKAGKPIVLEVEEGTTVGQLVARLGIPREAVRVAFRNGVVAEDTTPLSDGDEVGFFPPIAGGTILAL
ncbi:MAG: MoaD/ThiS family protein [Armatimonadota bacterium]|nr:MoaD/ThiS family protein [Armatimonadota bacterium]MDR5703106.1 MoaD/ThiS family protein [Armatimonadota bacterium]